MTHKPEEPTGQPHPYLAAVGLAMAGTNPPASFERHVHGANESELVFAGGPKGYSRVVLAVGQVTGADRRPDPSWSLLRGKGTVSSKP